jgi:hypothetical protein
MIKKLLVGLLSFSATLACGITTVKEIENEIHKVDMSNAVSSDDMIEYDPNNYGYNDILNYYRNLYGEENIYNLEFVSDVFYNVSNFNQNDMNLAYNLEYDLYSPDTKDPIDNTCALIAVTEIVDYYSNILGEFKSDSDENELYMKVVNACLKAGCTSRQDGTEKGEIADCISAGFKRFGSKRRGDSNWYYLLDNIKDAVRWRSALQMSLSDHSVVVRGLLKYKLTYNKPFLNGTARLKTTETVTFVHISEGWGYDYGALIPADRIYNRSSGHQVTWAKK